MNILLNYLYKILKTDSFLFDPRDCRGGFCQPEHCQTRKSRHGNAHGQHKHPESQFTDTSASIAVLMMTARSGNPTQTVISTAIPPLYRLSMSSIRRIAGNCDIPIGCFFLSYCNS